MTALYECVHRGERYFGLGTPGDTDLTLYPLGGDGLRARLLAAAGDGLLPGGALPTDALTAGLDPVTVPAREVDLRPPLLPDALGDAMVSGFMATHNVKVDETTQSQPNWFLKGLGDVLKVSGEPLRTAPEPLALCEEAEVVLVYVVDDERVPRYIGYGLGNDLTDIGRFKRHAGHLSYAKLCDAALSPWLFLDAPPQEVHGQTTIERDHAPAWQGTFTTGVKALHYGLRDMIAELFSYQALLLPGRVHYVYLGADRGSFHDGFALADRDRVGIEFTTHGVTLTNTVRCHDRG
ncbi:FAH family protein [Actinacidiphila sp. ITFR-21]|uniref:FAH family protein n=1 Tax=Actinacidiphila sp. ITFR-21 TaxID=3075199 RepID=UPI00288AFF00|nr:FAH family protein [Streptomyces sp. ITFR-21]WNI14999.1 FAH family protein [Streptomyces sp. ITFR-21]